MPRRRARLLGWAALSALVPLLARGAVQARLEQDLEPALERAVGAPVSVGGVEAGLTGTLRLDRISIAGLVRADAVEVSANLADLLAGRIAPAEVRIDGPRLRLEVAPDGATSLDPVIARLRERLAGLTDRRGEGAPALRRIAITGGALSVEVPGLGTLEAADVELHPRPGSARLVTGRVALDLAAGGFRGELSFDRAAADLDLPGLSPARLLAVGGAGTVRGPAGAAAALTSLALWRDSAGALRLAGRFAGPADRTIEVVAAGDRLRARLDGAPLAALAGALPGWLELEEARATGQLAIARVAPAVSTPRGAEHPALAGAFDVAGELALDDLVLTHPRLAGRPVPIGAGGARVRARGSLVLGPGGRALALDELRLSRGEVALDLRGRLDWRTASMLPDRADLAVTLPATSCAAALAAIPPALRPALTGLELAGTLSGSGHLAFDRDEPRRTTLSLEASAGGCRALTEAPLADPRMLLAPFDHRRPDGTVVRVGEGPDHTPLAALPRHVPGAFVAAEDARFFQHRGFDLEQIERSLAIDLEAGALVRGGSTISQQLVKNVYLGHQRTAARKLQEAIVTWRVEEVAGKRIILGRYLDLVELGPRVSGVTAAARHWFGRAPGQLTVRQAAFLAALTPAPRSYDRLIRQHGGLPPELVRRTDVVLRAMRLAGVIDRATLERARREPLVLRPAALASR